MAKTRIFSKTRPQALQAFRIPAPTIRRQAGEAESPFAQAIPLPPSEDELLQERYVAWEAQTNGSLPEFIAWEYLTLKRKLTPGVDFVFQAPFLGGRTVFGGFVLDFYFPARREGWFIQGLRYHLLNPADRGKNALAKVFMAGKGIKTLEIWEDDLLERPDFVLDAAYFRGQEVARRAVV